MPLPKPRSFTAEDYWNLPEGVRAELIDGELYDMAPPTRVHQKIVLRISRVIDEYIERHNGECEVYPAPFAVNLNADDTTYVEPPQAAAWTTSPREASIPTQGYANTG